MENRDFFDGKWLRGLYYTGIASLVSFAVSLIPQIPASLTTWIGRCLTAAVILCTYSLSHRSPRYQKAALFRSIMLALTLLNAYLAASSALTLAASILSILSVYQEYHAHGEWASEIDPKFGDQWRSLFYWGLGAGLLTSFGTMIAAVILTVMEMDAQKAAVGILIVMSIPQTVIDVIYLSYLNRLLKLLPSG